MIDRWIVDSKPSNRYPIYTRANVGEVFPDPVAPLSGDLITLHSETGWRDAFARFGSNDHDEFDPNNNEIIGIFGGYCYLNVTISRILGVRTPGLTAESIDYQLWGEMPGVPPYAPQPTDESPAHSERIMQTLGWVLTADSLPELLADEKMLDELRDARPDFTQMSERELVDRVTGLFDAHFRHLFGQHIFTTYCSTVPVGIIQQVCAAVGRPGDFLKLMAGVGDVESAAPSYAMWKLSRLDSDSDEFKGGLRGLRERLRRSWSERVGDALADVGDRPRARLGGYRADATFTRQRVADRTPGGSIGGARAHWRRDRRDARGRSRDARSVHGGVACCTDLPRGA